MTATYTRSNYARTTTIAHHVLTQQMDRARRMEEDARRLHDQLAHEVGYERVRVDQVKPGDVIESNMTGVAYEVRSIGRRVDSSGIGETWEVAFADAGGVVAYDEGQFVTRYLPQDLEAF